MFSRKGWNFEIIMTFNDIWNGLQSLTDIIKYNAYYKNSNKTIKRDLFKFSNRQFTRC